MRSYTFSQRRYTSLIAILCESTILDIRYASTSNTILKPFSAPRERCGLGRTTSPAKPGARPAWKPGAVATSTSQRVPDVVSRKFKEGFNTHIPLTYLTDKACLQGQSKAFQDTLSYDETSRRLVSTYQTLSDAGETELTFEEWCSAWRRLQALINEYLSAQEASAWAAHFAMIYDQPDRTSEWPLWLAYDIEVRRRACETALDPSVLQQPIFTACHRRYLTSIAESSSSRRDPPADRNNSPFPRSSAPRPSFRQKSDRYQPYPSRSTGARCFFCGTSKHLAPECNASTMVNGEPLHLRVRRNGDKPRDNLNRTYCFPFNGQRGCGKASGTCTLGEHLCSLCGESAHNAQHCRVVIPK